MRVGEGEDGRGEEGGDGRERVEEGAVDFVGEDGYGARLVGRGEGYKGGEEGGGEDGAGWIVGVATGVLAATDLLLSPRG